MKNDNVLYVITYNQGTNRINISDKLGQTILVYVWGRVNDSIKLCNKFKALIKKVDKERGETTIARLLYREWTVTPTDETYIIKTRLINHYNNIEDIFSGVYHMFPDKSLEEYKAYTIWQEGYSCTGERAKASFLGFGVGKTFREAVIDYMDNHPKDEKLII